ncbi:hypothetical protein F5B22DRAFT_366395 [Xylaria bambusicola]|uniref:uncharacterized protein n=1 Tax=Xylaria bambusicola TaxID=326684 RepID=UPI00200892CE|nr:uncharacterized protein F5B22DRAFT_366395 [Xylaria bambusicola]KAI0509212.1 hypothetical protein F5B22DRAFT_366395 [Xylaria bambusicola]
MDYAASTFSRIQGSGTASSNGAFGKAIDEFLGELKEKHKDDAKNPFLQALIGHDETKRAEDGVSQSEVSAQELQSSILQLDAKKRTGKGYRLLHRLNPFLDVLKTLLKKSEAFSQVAPFGVAIAFIGARIVLEMALAVEEYLEVVVTAMERIAGILEVYKRLSSSPDLGPRLVNSYKAIITFWYKLSKVLSSSKIKGILPRTMLTSLQKETEDALKNLQEDMQVNLGISQAAGLLMADIDRQVRVDADQRALKNDIRRWIMGQNNVDFKGDYETQLEMRYKDTCAWVLEDQRFLDWQDSRDNALLWYNAPPGSGKSVLAATVINDLTKYNKKVAYFFYSFSKNSSRHVADGLRILALQLLAFVGTPSDKLVDLYETETQFAPYLNNLRTTVSVVHELITRNDNLYIVLDGIDECGDEKEMLPLLERLIEQPTLGTVRWLFTSRVSEVEKAMKRLQAVEIHPSPDNIREDIKNYLAPKISCEECLHDWVDECDNNFLIARFVSETLGKLTSEADIKAELKIFPKKLNGYYMRTLTKIDARGQMEQLVARRIFLILGSAQQTISIDELVDALAIQRGSQDYSTLRLPKEELIHDLCGSLIVIEQCTTGTPGHSPLVRFCHKSVKDFFQQDPKTCDFGVDESLHKYFVAPTDADEEIGLDCLTYLMYGRYTKHIDLGFLDSTIPKEHAFLRYAATFWFQHLGDDSIEKPSSAAAQAVREFLSSKNFWNCLRVQSHIAPYLFGRYTGYRPGGYKMAIRGKEWKGNDSFAIPLPTWLSDNSSDDLMRDQSLCHFVEEWREVIITQPQGLDQCVSMKAFPNSCWLKSLCKTSTVKGVNLAETFGSDVISTSQLLGVGFSGKKLCVDMAYQTKDGPTDVLYRLKQQLFKANSRPQRSQQKIPLGSGISKWAITAVDEEGVSKQLTAWSVDPSSLNVRMMRGEHSEPFDAPSLSIKGRRTSPNISWEMLGTYKHDYHETGADVDKSIYVFHMSQQAIRAEPIDDDDDAEDSDDSDNDAEATSDEEESDDEDEFSDDDDSSSDRSSDESAAEETSTDESDAESDCCHHEDTDCLIIISPGRSPFWTKPWTHPALLWSRNMCAMHPTEPLVAFMTAPTQIGVVQGETQRSIEISGLEDEPEDVLASARELRFSRCGKYLYYASVVFVERDHFTECTVTASCLEFSLDQEDDAAKTITASQIARVVYAFAEPLEAIEPPFALTYWSDDYVIIALPHLTCNPKILKIALNSDVSHPVSTLCNPIYFPASTPRRDARLVHRPSSRDSEGYIFLVLNAVPVAAVAKDGAVSDTSSPVTALRWSVSDDEGWRPWSEDEDATLSDLTRGYSPLWNFMRGSFVESGKPFSVPVRSGLNWTRKSYLSCV